MKNLINQFDIVEIVGNYDSHPHPETDKSMKKGHLGFVLKRDGHDVYVWPFGYPYVAHFLSNEVELKYSTGIDKKEILGYALGSDSYAIGVFINDRVTTIQNKVSYMELLGYYTVSKQRTIDSILKQNQ